MVSKKGFFKIGENRIQFDIHLMNKKQKEIFINFKRELVKESILIDKNLVKIDQNLIDELNNNSIIDLKHLNQKQRDLFDFCVQELENSTKTIVKKKRLENEKYLNTVIRAHLGELKKYLNASQVKNFREFLKENKLLTAEKILNESHEAKDNVPQVLTQAAILTPVLLLPTMSLSNQFVLLNNLSCFIPTANINKS